MDTKKLINVMKHRHDYYSYKEYCNECGIEIKSFVEFVYFINSIWDDGIHNSVRNVHIKHEFAEMRSCCGGGEVK